MAQPDSEWEEYDASAFGSDGVPPAAAVKSPSLDDDGESEFSAADAESEFSDDDSDFEEPSSKKRKRAPAKKKAPAAKKAKKAAAKPKAKAKKAATKTAGKKVTTKTSSAKRTSTSSTTSTSSSSSSSSDTSSTSPTTTGSGKPAKRVKKSSPKTKAKPGKKAATKKITGDALNVAIVAYLDKSNRPHSEKEVWENMHKPTAMTNMKKVLKALAASGELGILVNGKFTIFWVNQERYTEFTPDKISTLDQEGETLRLQLTELKNESSELSKEINSLKGRPTFDVLRTQLETVTTDLDAAKAKAEQLASGSSKPVDPKARDNLIKRGKEWLKLWKTRKENLSDIIDQMSDGTGKKPKKLAQDMDLDMDFEKPSKYSVVKGSFNDLIKNMK